MSKYESYTIPKYYPRAQVTGVVRWTCVYCAYVIMHQLRPLAIRLTCPRCDHILIYGSAFHIPAGALTTKFEDDTVPIWVDDEYPFDPIEFDPFPAALFDSTKRITQRGRTHAVVIHKNFYISGQPMPISPETCKIYTPEES